ncbi:unnamed protein product [Choristocarpus tenellus]|uniref:Photosystem I subunit III n=1 Tax=Choristocarpus tenellus TaxID=116065 RepID=UPI002E77F43A|nr:Photosystem I subunit III [Choristocarpus tenellus]WAM62359.1 Photosystem I subunit III [Choristocarpus tenellus]
MSQLKKTLIIILLVVISQPLNTLAEVAGLTKCSESTMFKKRLETSVRKLETRLKKYEPNSPSALMLEQQIKRTNDRFTRYSESGLLCGKEGLPHLITDGRLNHATEFVIPGVLFIYISGWIGWVGRKYIRIIKETANPTEKEIIIDVPLAVKLMASGFVWPFSAIQELSNGDFLMSDSNITVSPR